MKKTVCFYHSADLDGHCSGAIVRKVFPQAQLVGANYGDVDQVRRMLPSGFELVTQAYFCPPRKCFTEEFPC